MTSTRGGNNTLKFLPVRKEIYKEIYFVKLSFVINLIFILDNYLKTNILYDYENKC